MPEIGMNSLKSLAMNCGPLSDPWPRFRVLLLRPLQDDLDVRLGHRFPQIPVDDVATAAVRRYASADELRAAGRTHGHDVCVDHHEGQPAVALQRVFQVEPTDGLLLPLLQAEISENPAV